MKTSEAPKELVLEKIISGGQTGADRAGLEAAHEMEMKTGGTAPHGFRTDNGFDLTLKKFGLFEHPSPGYRERTIQNIHDSDGTVWFGNPQSPGGKLTIGTVIQVGKPFIVNPNPVDLAEWLTENQIRTLNVAGNRERTNPGIGEAVKVKIKTAVLIAKEWKWDK